MTLKVLISLTGELWPGYIKIKPEPRPPRTRKRSTAAELREAKKAGAIGATVTRPDGVAVSATFVEPAKRLPPSTPGLPPLLTSKQRGRH
jgi:hypothetical protein